MAIGLMKEDFVVACNNQHLLSYPSPNDEIVNRFEVIGRNGLTLAVKNISYTSITEDEMEKNQNV